MCSCRRRPGNAASYARVDEASSRVEQQSQNMGDASQEARTACSWAIQHGNACWPGSGTVLRQKSQAEIRESSCVQTGEPRGKLRPRLDTAAARHDGKSDKV